jgi:pilus assembly protein CpaE
MISVQSDRDYMRRAMQAGAVDFLPKPPSADELYATVRTAYERRPKSRQPVREDDGIRAPSAKGQTIVVYSPQAGAGVTSVAVNLAAGLMSPQERTVLVDANVQFGDVAVHLDLKNERGLLNLTEVSEDIDVELIENVLSTHGSGLRVLPAPRTIEEAARVTGERMLTVVKTLAEQFKYVVVDTHTQFDRISVSLIELADALVLVGTPVLPAVKNLKLVLDLFDQSEDFNKNKIIFVMNRVPADKKSGALNPEDISRALKLPVRAIIPALERPFLESLNRGAPVIVNPRQSPGREFQMLAEEVKKMLTPQEVAEAESPDAKAARRGIFGR